MIRLEPRLRRDQCQDLFSNPSSLSDETLSHGWSSYGLSYWWDIKRKLKLKIYWLPCCLLMTIANSIDPELWSGSGSKPFDTLIVFLKESFEKVTFVSSDNKSMKN